MTPRFNNVYGQVIAPSGLRPVQVAVERVLGPGTAAVFRSRASDTETLRIRSDAADLETLPLAGGMEYLLNGSVSGTAPEVAAFVRALSAALMDVKVEHNFEVHDGRRVILSLP